MVTMIVIAALVAAGVYIRLSFRIRYYREKCESYQALYENEQAWRIDLDGELATTQVQLADSRASVSRLIARHASAWAETEAKRIH